MFGTKTAGAPGVTTAVSGIMNIATKFVVPIAALGAGWLMGETLATGIGDWLVAFVPGLNKVQSWTAQKDKSMNIGLILAGAIVIGGAVLAGTLVTGFLGGAGILASTVGRAIIAFGIGAGLKAVINGFGPAKAAMEAVT